jgi:hypothetical protein
MSAVLSDLKPANVEQSTKSKRGTGERQLEHDWGHPSVEGTSIIQNPGSFPESMNLSITC